MIFNVAALVLVLGITFLHSMFGFYSGLVNVFCSVTALAVGFGYFETLTDFVSSQIDWPTAYIEPASLIVLFALTLVVLRTLADQFLRGNVRVPQYLDWAGGAACGFVIAQICVGVLALGFLMLPWGGRVAMYQRYERSPENRTDLETGRAEFIKQGLWLGSDSFAAGLFNLLSNGSLKSDTRFSSVYPDFPEWVAWTGNTVQTESFTSPLRDPARLAKADAPLFALGGAMLGAGSGIIVGGIIGAVTRGERWEQVPSDRWHLSITPRPRGGVALAVSVTF